MVRSRTGLRHSAGLAATCLLTACGGGDGGGIATTPAPAFTPVPVSSPAPTPVSTPVDYDTATYRATVGAVSMNALAAYNAGATGAGATIGIVDSGLDVASTAFAGRISAASQSVAGAGTYDDQNGHGTAVAFTAAGSRTSGIGSQGVAFAATLVIERADTPGSCAATSTDDIKNGCSFSTTAIAAGVDAARIAGARVINLSLGGTTMPDNLVQALGRATAAGIVIVIAAGNDGAANPDAFTAIANNAAIARNQIIIAGSVGATDAISSFSDQAGTSAAHYLTAVGEKVRAPCFDTMVCLWSGTSFSTPQISGAVALLAQAFPNLTGAQIVDILYRTARDVGTPGVDTVYGNGVLDLTRAFQPVGTTSVAGTTTIVSTVSNASLSAPMGDAHGTGLAAVILDSYARAYAIDLAQTIRHNGPARQFVGTLQSHQQNVAMDAGGLTVALTLAPQTNGDLAADRTAISSGDRAVSRVLAGTVIQRLGGTATVGVAFAAGAGGLTAQMAGIASPAFLVARDDAMGFDSIATGASAVRQRFGSLGLTGSVETGAVLSPRDPALAEPGYRRSTYAKYSVALDQRVGGLTTLIGATHLAEADSVLGARFGDALGAARAGTWFLDADARWAAGQGWSIGGSYRQGWTGAVVRDGLIGGGGVRTQAFAADIGKDGIFDRDSLGLRIAQPLRVANGGIDFALPTAYDDQTAAVTRWSTETLNLAPDGRELDVEARYSRPLGKGSVQTNIFWRRDPGNFATLPPDYGWALRFGLVF